MMINNVIVLISIFTICLAVRIFGLLGFEKYYNYFIIFINILIN